ncbi:MAG TPA: OmpH family outer membrane protein [Candidatus Edwardsbacteria bacterium]|nr:OmpH family outer membrane protein [Candidatus Edwardsbacteria bacterium]
MKRILIMAAAAAALAAWAAPGLCQKIGYVNSDSIFARYHGAQDVRQEMARAQAAWNQEVDARKKQIDSLQKALDDQMLVISSERRRTRQEEIKTRKQELENYIHDVFDPKGKADQKNRELSKPMVEKVGTAIKKVALDNNLQMVLDGSAGNIVYAAKDLDITADVIDELEKAEGGAAGGIASIVVYPFKEDAEAARKSYAKVLLPYLNGALDRTRAIKPVPQQQVLQLLKDKGMENAEVSQLKGIELAKVLGARYMVLNAVTANPGNGQITVSCRLFSVDDDLLLSEELEIALDDKSLASVCEKLADRLVAKAGQQ